MTLDELVGRVRTTMEENDVSFAAAVAGVHAELAGNGDLRAFWEKAGRELLHKALSPHFRKKSGYQATSPRRPAPAKNPSWREMLKQDPDSIWEIEMPVPCSGEVKAFGDWTFDDVMALEDYYSGWISKLTTRRELVRRLRKKMRADDTIRGAYDAGRIGDTDLTFASRARRDTVLALAGESGEGEG